MKTKILSFLTWGCIVGMLAACGPSAQQDNATEAEAPATEETTAQAAEDERPSPLRKISGTIDGVQIELQYSSPAVKGRTVWGELVKYGEVWRTGANEATWVAFDKAVDLGGTTVPAGKYALFTIPTSNETWTVVLNSEWNQWGAYDYSADKDVARLTVMVETQEAMSERLNFTIGEGITFEWENASFTIPVTAAAS